MKGTAIVICEGRYATINGKTAHGLVRGTERYRILAVVDPPTAGRDAGEVLDGTSRGIPIFATINESLERLPSKPDYAIVGIATSAGRMTAGLRASPREALEKGLSVVNGLHEFAGDAADLAGLARKNRLTITEHPGRDPADRGERRAHGPAAQPRRLFSENRRPAGLRRRAGRPLLRAG